MFRKSWILIMVLVAGACASKSSDMTVRTNAQQGADFSSLESFRPAASVPGSNPPFPRFQEMAKSAIEEELVSRGYARLDAGTPEFRVRTTLQFSNYTTPGSGVTTAPTTGEPVVEKKDVRNVTMRVEIMRPGNPEPIWSGTVTGFDLDPVQPRNNLRVAARRLLAEFPPLW